MLKIEDLLRGKERICVVGLGYVGLPLAVLLSSRYEVIAYDLNPHRVEELKKGFDSSGEIDNASLKNSSLKFTCKEDEIAPARVFIVAVPTPIDQSNQPDLHCIKLATEGVARQLRQDCIVVYESTVYPGTTEEICVPILEEVSGLKWKKDFYVGYSPERVNPGDTEHTIDKIIKVVSGDCTESSELLLKLYGSVISAGVHRAPDLKTAEAAKVIENTQRDLNIALMNELAVIFNRMNLETHEVLAAARTKWNFLDFSPGLVGGHCIGVDPYYLTYKSECLGYHPEMILAGRRINDNMGKYIAEATVKGLIKTGKKVKGSKILILGMSFKENICDIRNTRVVDIYHELEDFETTPYIYDPHVDRKKAEEIYGISMLPSIETHVPYQAVIAAVPHKSFLEGVSLDMIASVQNGSTPILIDVKCLYRKAQALQNNIHYWQL